MKRTAAAFIVIGLAWVAGVQAQEKPNFSGRWIVIAPAESAGTEQIITHDLKVNTLTLQHDSEGNGHKLVHTVDGTQHRNALASHGSEIVILSKAQWIGNQIAISSVVSYPDGRRMQSKQLWFIDTNGQLVVDGTETIDGRTTAIKVVHKKS